jgi:hypothetical protein
MPRRCALSDTPIPRASRSLLAPPTKPHATQLLRNEPCQRLALVPCGPIRFVAPLLYTGGGLRTTAPAISMLRYGEIIGALGAYSSSCIGMHAMLYINSTICYLVTF